MPAAREELILAIDAGTQSMRAALVDLSGALLHTVKTPIEPYFSTQPGWAEQQPGYYWDRLCQTTRQLLDAQPQARERLVAVTLTTQRLTMVNVDERGEPLRPAIVWMDQRKAALKQVLPAPLLLALKATPYYPLIEYATQYARQNWLRQNQPELWARTHKFLFLSGFLTLRLTGEYRDSAANVIGTFPFDVKKFDWAGPWDPKWRLFPVEKEKLSQLVMPSDILGKITRQAAEATGIPAHLPLLAAANDKACDIIGSGCLTPERACISFGTTATLNTQINRYVELRPLMAPYPSAIPKQYYTEISVVRGLWMVSWFKEEFGLQERMLAEETQAEPEELLERLLRDVPPGSMGLMCQPYWTPGPELASYTKGALFGFGAVHTRAYVYRAIVEGLVYALKEGAQLTEKKNKIPITGIRATGGGSRSDTILQITADVFNLPVERPRTNETSVLGAAMDAAVGLGYYRDIPAAVAAMTKVKDGFEPIPQNVSIYKDLYENVYLKAYERLLPLYKDIQTATGYPAE